MTNSKDSGGRRLGGIVAIAATVVLFAVPASAGAADWRGTVVDVDRSRDTIATTTRSGEVRTARLPSRAVGRARVGQRVSIYGGRELADGTYRAKRTRARGRSASARLRGTIVGQDRRTGRTFVSAGQSVVAIRPGSGRRARAAAARPQPGDRVLTRVRFRSGSSALRATRVQTVGEATAVELEGIALGVRDGVLRIAVARRGEVAISVPEGLLSEAPAAGDQIKVVVSVASDGSFTLVALDSEDDGSDDDLDHGMELDEETGEIEAEGILGALAPESVSVLVGDQTLTCLLPPGVDLSAFTVGEEVEARCQIVDGMAVLRELESEQAELKVEDDGTFTLEDERVEEADEQAEDEDEEREDQDEDEEREDEDD